MGKQYGLLFNLDRCTGCYACEVACAQWHHVPLDKKWIRVQAIGPERIDGKLKMDFIPIMNGGCTFCQDRVKDKLLPLCVVTCLTQALEFVDDKRALELLSSGKRYQICKLGVLD